MSTLYRLSVVVHILAAATWVGGTLFLALVSLPVTRRLPDGDLRRSVLVATALRFRTVAWVSIALLAVTGAVNAVGRWGWPTLTQSGFWRSEPGLLLALKLTLVAIVVLMAATHDFYLGPRVAESWPGGAPPAQTDRRRRVTLVLARAQLAVLVAVVAAAVLIVGGMP